MAEEKQTRHYLCDYVCLANPQSIIPRERRRTRHPDKCPVECRLEHYFPQPSSVTSEHQQAGRHLDRNKEILFVETITETGGGKGAQDEDWGEGMGVLAFHFKRRRISGVYLLILPSFLSLFGGLKNLVFNFEVSFLTLISDWLFLPGRAFKFISWSLKIIKRWTSIKSIYLSTCSICFDLDKLRAPKTNQPVKLNQ